MKTQKYFLAIILTLTLCWGVANAARITLETDESATDDIVCRPKIFFDGAIESKDLDTLKRIVDKTCLAMKKNKQGVIEYTLSLNSDGGDVDAALAIGRFIRNISFSGTKAYFHVQVWKRYHCYSSCVFILAAGARRLPFGDIGIHRPYLVQLDTKYSADEIRRIRSAQNKNIKEYLIEMDVAESLLDAMLAIPADKIKILTENEITQFRLTGDDANFEEKNKAADASEWFLSSAEYRKREAEVTQKCGRMSTDNSEWFVRCETTVMLKISDAEFDARLKKIRDVCSKPEFENDTRALHSCIFRVRAGK